MISTALLLWLAGAPLETRVAASAGVPWGAALTCEYQYRGPCGVPTSVGVRLERAVHQGTVGPLPSTLRLGAALDVHGTFGGGAGAVFGVVPMGLLRWGLGLTPRFELSVFAAVGVALTPAATQLAMLFVNAGLAGHLTLGERWYVGVEAGPFAGELLLGVRW